MRSFKFKMRRTQNYNQKGQRTPNTFNSSGLFNQYYNTNPRFNTKYGTKNSRSNAEPETPYTGPRTSCTITGCGKQCCTSTLLLSNITWSKWETNFKYGLNLKPGQKVFLVKDWSDKKEVGILEDIVITNTNTYIPQIGVQDCSGAFPINIEMMVSGGPKGCEYIDIFEYNMVYVSNHKLHPITDQIVITNPGLGRVGAPYRAPIGGSRKTLECCPLPKYNGEGHAPTNDVYKDMHAKYTGRFNPGQLNGDGKSVPITDSPKKCVAYDNRIRSGMQPKQQMCVTGINGTRGNKLLCRDECGYQKPYSFSYSQYNKNRALNTYERGLEINSPNKQPNKQSSCPDKNECRNKLYPNKKSSYRKSAGDACLACSIDNNNSNKLISKNAKTVWKPNNKKFKVQGAVSSGGRLERLKVDTIRAANSKCKKGERCNDGNGNGKYFAGKPRFTGWIYNESHQERVWPNKNISAIRYRPQPLGIPQLTNKGRSTRSNVGNINWKPHSSGTYGYNQRKDSHNIRAPGYGNKCIADCPMSDCVKPIGLRTFEEWNIEYNGASNARYQGNRKCKEVPTISARNLGLNINQ